MPLPCQDLLQEYWTYAFAEESAKPEYMSLLEKFKADNRDVVTVRTALEKLRSFKQTLRPGATNSLQTAILDACLAILADAKSQAETSSMTQQGLESACLTAKKLIDIVPVDHEKMKLLDSGLECLRPQIQEAHTKNKRAALFSWVSSLDAAGTTEMCVAKGKLHKDLEADGVFLDDSKEHDEATRPKNRFVAT